MNETENRIEPIAIAQKVDAYVSNQHRNAAKYSNSELLDESGVYELHNLAAAIYAIGFNDGEVVQSWRETAQQQRIREAAKDARSLAEGKTE